jgi:predicted DNA-binding transcriptional regulator YafY
MLLKTAINLLQLLGAHEGAAMTTTQIKEKFNRPLKVDDQVTLKSIQNYVKDLRELDLIEEPLVDGGEYKYYLKVSRVANWFMTEEAALELQIAGQIYGQSFGRADPSNSERLQAVAEGMKATGETRRIRDHLRVVGDGIGRLHANIDRDVLKCAIKAIKQNRQINFTYLGPNWTAAKEYPGIIPLGLVAKDRTIYLLGVKGDEDMPKEFALHRAISMQATHPVGIPVEDSPRARFDLDLYIRNTHELSHPINAGLPSKLVLRVKHDATYHFKERPLSNDQSIEPESGRDGFFRVEATVPDTVLLTPFLVSMGPWIEVIGPPQVREKVSQWLKDTSALYAN